MEMTAVAEVPVTGAGQGDPAAVGGSAAGHPGGAEVAARGAAADADGVRWLSEDEQRSWRAYLQGSARLTEALTRQLETDSQVSLSEYEILVRLSESGEHTLRMSELASSLVHSRSRLTHTVSRMERRGLVRRQNCLDDGRGVNCVLTDEGMELLRAAAPGHVRTVRAQLVDRLTPEQFRALGEAMAIIGADAEDLPPSPTGPTGRGAAVRGEGPEAAAADDA